MKKLTITVLLVVTSTFLVGQGDDGVKFISDNYFDALQMANKEDKPIFIEFGVNCGYCYKMKKEVFTDQDVGAYFNTYFINLIVDERSPIGKDLAERFNVYSYPTYFFLSSDGDITHISANFKTPENMIKEGEKALNDKEYSPSGVWWNKLKTRNKKTYDLFNTANDSFILLTDFVADFSTSNLDITDLTSLNLDHLDKSSQLILESLQIEEYYFNTFVASIIYYLKNDQEQALIYAEKALNEFPQHQRVMRQGTRDELLNNMISSIKVN